jgi:hypothetical protein
MQEELRATKEQLQQNQTLSKAKDEYLASYNAQMQVAMQIRNLNY